IQIAVGALAGAHSFQVRAAAASDPSEVAVADIALQVAAIEASTALTLELRPTRQQVRGGARARFSVAIHNTTNADQSIDLAVAALAIWLLGQPGRRGPDLPAGPPTPPQIVRFGLNQPIDDAPAFLPPAWDVRNAEHTTLERKAGEQGAAPRTFKPIERTDY